MEFMVYKDRKNMLAIPGEHGRTLQSTLDHTIHTLVRSLLWDTVVGAMDFELV